MQKTVKFIISINGKISEINMNRVKINNNLEEIYNKYFIESINDILLAAEKSYSKSVFFNKFNQFFRLAKHSITRE